jgi:hypothetical protein
VKPNRTKPKRQQKIRHPPRGKREIRNQLRPRKIHLNRKKNQPMNIRTQKPPLVGCGAS